MRALHDLRCTSCNTTMRDVYVSYPETPACDVCGGATAITMEFWGTTSSLQIKTFARRDFGNGIVATNAQEEAQVLAEVKRRYPNDEFYLESRTRAEAKQRADEIRHAARMERAAIGVDDAAIAAQKELRAATAREAAIAAGRANQDPSAAAARAIQSVPSPVELATGSAPGAARTPELVQAKGAPPKAQIVSYTPAAVSPA